MNPASRRTPLGALLAAALLLPAATALAQVDPPHVDPTHYWTYLAQQDVFHPASIFVHDQFFRDGVSLSVDRLERLLNWVHKNNSVVRDTFLHYTWWNVPEKLPMPREVDVLNQFGLHTVTIHNVEFLLTPALKYVQPPVIPPANHYLCYRAHGFPGTDTPYFLQDEWRFDYQAIQPMEYFCLPCTKQHQGGTYEAPDTLTHLAVYPVAPTSGHFSPFVTDQFWAEALFVGQTPPEYLFVPSEKFERPTAGERRSWGRIKSLYR